MQKNERIKAKKCVRRAICGRIFFVVYYFLSFFTISSVSEAIISSSFVGRR